jgi:hypothetical protein
MRINFIQNVAVKFNGKSSANKQKYENKLLVYLMFKNWQMRFIE